VWHLKGDDDRASADLDRALAVDPGNSSAWTARGNLFLTHSHWADAINAYDKVLAADPGRLEAYVNRGTTYARLADYNHAISDFDAALRLGGRAAELFADLGLVQMQTGNYGAAIVNFRFRACDCARRREDPVQPRNRETEKC
jgi:tetratricopeptide (TPR) repeat protein